MVKREQLPIFERRGEFIVAVMQSQILIVVGETGSGKSTQISQYLAEAGFVSCGVVACTQPRRVAAQAISRRVAEEVGCRLGHEVGYSVRFDDNTSARTVIKYLTDGLLLRELLSDLRLTRYSAVVLDEAHERTVDTDVLFGVTKDVLTLRRELRLVVTSATLEADKFSTYFCGAPVFAIKGRMFHVQRLYFRKVNLIYFESILAVICKVHIYEECGDVLVFLSGQEEIDLVCRCLGRRFKEVGRSFLRLAALPIYGALPCEVQTFIFHAAPVGVRKCVVATNIAETSITVNGIYYVVDPGLCKINLYNPRNGIESLVVTPISKSSAGQRAGRAGRTGPGRCYRLYTELAYRFEMLDSGMPVIQRCNLSVTVLTLKALGVAELAEFDFMDAPSLLNIISALEILFNLGAVDCCGILTNLGRRMAEFPMDPCLSKVLMAAVELGCSDEAVSIISMLQVQIVFFRPCDGEDHADRIRSRFFRVQGDHLTLLTVYNSWRDTGFSVQWCYENFVQVRSMRTAQRTRRQLLEILDRYRLCLLCAGWRISRVQRSITSGYFIHCVKKVDMNRYRSLSDLQLLYVHPSSSLFNVQPDWALYHSTVVTSKEYMREVMHVFPEWLIEVAPHFFRIGDLK